VNTFNDEDNDDDKNEDDEDTRSEDDSPSILLLRAANSSIGLNYKILRSINATTMTPNCPIGWRSSTRVGADNRRRRRMTRRIHCVIKDGRVKRIKGSKV